MAVWSARAAPLPEVAGNARECSRACARALSPIFPSSNVGRVPCLAAISQCSPCSCLAAVPSTAVLRRRRTDSSARQGARPQGGTRDRRSTKPSSKALTAAARCASPPPSFRPARSLLLVCVLSVSKRLLVRAARHGADGLSVSLACADAYSRATAREELCCWCYRWRWCCAIRAGTAAGSHRWKRRAVALAA